MGRQEELRSQKIGPLLLKFSVPAMVGMIVSALYNVVDRVFVGRLGFLAMTGIGLNLPIMTTLLAFSMLVGIGAAARISIRLGEGKKEEAEKVLGNALVLLVVNMLVLSSLLMLFREKLLYLFGASPDTIVYAKEYITIILLGAVCQSVAFGLNHCMRAEGQPGKAMMTLLIGAILNMILDPLFIFTFKMGISGAALATVLSQLVSMLWVLSHFLSPKSMLKLRKENFSLDRKVVISILSIGMAPFAIQIAASVSGVIANNALRTYGGDVAIGAMTVVNSIAVFIVMPIFGINQGAQPIIGFNYGARQYDRVKKTFRLAILGATCISTGGFLLTRFAAEPLVRFFNKDPELMAVASQGMKILFMMMPVVGFQIVSSNYFQATGKAHKAMFLSVLRQVTLLVPLLLILPNFFGLMGIWMSGAIADIVSAVITAGFIYKELRSLRAMHEEEGILGEGPDSPLNLTP